MTLYLLCSHLVILMFTEKGIANGDVVGGPDNKGGDLLTNSDALQIQKFLINLVTEL